MFLASLCCCGNSENEVQIAGNISTQCFRSLVRGLHALAVHVIESWSHDCTMGTSVKTGVLLTNLTLLLVQHLVLGSWCLTERPKKKTVLSVLLVLSCCAFALCFRVPFCNQCHKLRAATLSAKGPSAYEIACCDKEHRQGDGGGDTGLGAMAKELQLPSLLLL